MRVEPRGEKLDEVVTIATGILGQLSSLPTQVKTKKSMNSIRLSNILEAQTGLITAPDFEGGEGIQLQGLDYRR